MSKAQMEINRALVLARDAASAAARVFHEHREGGITVPPEVAFHLGAFLGAMAAHHNGFLGTMETWDPRVGGDDDKDACCETCELELGEFERYSTGKGDLLCKGCYEAQIGGDD